jgi:Gas vesicle protein G
VAGIVTYVVTFPYAPVRIVTSLAKVLLREAEQELYGSASIRRQLEDLDEALESGALSQEEYEQAQQAILDRLVA